jgi:hypothetical protein
MNGLKTYLLGLASLVIVILALTLAHPDARNGVAAAFMDVRVVNTASRPANVRDVDDFARQPFQKEIIANLVPGADEVQEFVPITIPPGKRFVMEHASATGFVPAGQKLRMFVVTRLNSELTSHALVATPQGAFEGGRDVFTASQPIRLYAGTDDFIKVVAERNSTAVNGFVFFSVSGYLVDVP